MHFARILNISLLTVLLGLTSSAAQQRKPANPQLPDPNSETQPQRTESAQPASERNAPGRVSSEAKQTFSGRIVKSKAEFVLKEKSRYVTYKLDRQDIAKQYDGKDVRVSGSLDSSDNTIRVSTIEPLR